ncbi:MAG: class I fructose-bisphosphate aldolase [Nostocoides sp.]
MPTLAETASQLLRCDRGALAADGHPRAILAWLRAEGITPGDESGRDVHRMLITTPGLAKFLSAVILGASTFSEFLADGTPFPQACRQRGLLVGVTVDTGRSAIPRGEGALVTEGLDGLAERLARYAAAGAAFARWRAVIDVDHAHDLAISANAHGLARFAVLAQEAGLVPIVSAEVLTKGTHPIHRTALVSERTLNAVFSQLALHRVDPESLILATSFIAPGPSAPPATSEEVAAATIDVLRACVPASVPSVALLSSGHPVQQACAHLAATLARPQSVPWTRTFCFGRALTNPAVRAWGGRPERVHDGQRALLTWSARAANAMAGSGTSATRSSGSAPCRTNPMPGRLATS